MPSGLRLPSVLVSFLCLQGPAATAQNVTPPRIGEFQINSIDPSPHDPAWVYVAVTGFRRNDRTPMAFRSRDYGETWTRITDGFRSRDFVRVVREDPARRGLLYAGTESGVYFSLDDGQNWTSLQLNLPHLPITDLAAKNGDLVASTDGRGFWILDDLSPLHQFSNELASASLHLFQPRNAYRMAGNSAPRPGLGRNPFNGTLIDYSLNGVPSQPLQLEILDSSGGVVRTFTSEERAAVEAPGAVAPIRLSTRRGANRIGWDLRHQPITRVPGVFLVGVYFGTVDGFKVPPGQYQARLTLGEERRVRRFEILPDPRVETAAADFRLQAELLRKIRVSINEIHQSVIAIRSVREQAGDLIERSRELPIGVEASRIGQRLMAGITAWEELLIQPRHEAVMDVVNFPTMLNEQYLFLKGAVASADSRPTAGAARRFRDLEVQWREIKAERDRILENELKDLNQLFRRHDVPAVIVPDGR